jgi:hypothetical protein
MVSSMGTSGKKPLGQWLLDERVLDSAALQDALDEQRRLGGRLGDRLISTGRCKSGDVFRCLAKQHNLGFVNLHQQAPQPDALAVLSQGEARSLGVVPLSVQRGAGGDQLTLAVAGPEKRYLAQHLESRVGMHVEVVVADPEELKHALELYGTLGLPMMRPQSDAPAHRTLHLDEEPSFISGEHALPDEHIQRLVDLDLHGEDLAGGDQDVEPLSEADFADLNSDGDDVLEADAAGALEDLPEPRTLAAVSTGLGVVEEVANLSARVESLEAQLLQTRTQLEAALNVASRVGILEALVEQLLKTRPGVEEAQAQQREGEAVRARLVTSVVDALDRADEQARVASDALDDDLLSVVRVSESTPRDGVPTTWPVTPENGTDPDSETHRAAVTDTPPPLPPRRGGSLTPFAALLAEADTLGVVTTPAPQDAAAD